jgi:mannose-1-phosphate guanylyltransferase
MKAMLLAAGSGTRLRPLTNHIPKCLVPVAGKPVLQHNLEWLRSQGIVDFVVNLHLHPEMVTQRFGNGRSMGVHINYSYEPELMGTAGALRVVRRFFSQARFWVIYADNLISCHLNRLMHLHLSSQAVLTMALFWRQEVAASGVAQLSEDGRVIAFKEKPRPDEISSHWVNAGLFLCEPEILQFIPPDRPSDFGHEVLPALLAAGQRLQGYTMGPDESLYWIDTPADLAQTESIFAKNSLPA